MSVLSTGREDGIMYTYQARVRFSETDQNGQLTPGAILDYFQDTTSFEAEDSGIGISYLEENHCGWLLSGWQVQIERYPVMGEWIKVGTFPYDFKNFYGMRNFFLEDASGKVIAKANTIWTFMDRDKGSPARITEEILSFYTLCQKLEMEYEPRKIDIPEQMTRKEPVEIKAHHLDTNGHMNNAQYVKVAQEIAGIYEIKSLRADYRKSALLGDQMIPYVGSVIQEDKSVTHIVCFKDSYGTIYAIVEFR